LRLQECSADQIIAVSRHIQSCLPGAMKTSLLYDALDRPALPCKPPAGRRRMVFIGNYIQGKGQNDAIEAFALLAAEYPDLDLEFHGGDMGLAKNRAWRDGLIIRAAELGLAQRVSFGEFAEDPRSKLLGGYMALNFSTSESFSMTVLEASAAGLPVIATRSGGPAEIIEDGVTGLLVPVGDRREMAAAMRLLADDPVRAVAMGAAGRARVERLFSMPVFRAQLVGLLGLG
jgi:glycosyltransferase involved in cell wall biosynthesis